MVKGLLAFCIVAAAQVCSAYQVAVPVFRQPYGTGGTTHIIGGETATRGQFPYYAAITIDRQSFCGGSLIDKNWVLTTGHCVEDASQWNIVLGAQDLRDTNEPGRITVDSNEAILHEDFDPEYLVNDVGVIRLPTDVFFSDYINSIALPPRSLKDEDLVGRQVRVSGWGRTSDESTSLSPTLQFVDLNVISLEDCNEEYGNVADTQYCCRGDNNKSTCIGDSGGSLTIGSGENIIHIGIVSYGSDKGCAKGYPLGVTATPHFVDWISSKTGIPVTDF